MKTRDYETILYVKGREFDKQWQGEADSSKARLGIKMQQIDH